MTINAIDATKHLTERIYEAVGAPKDAKNDATDRMAAVFLEVFCEHPELADRVIRNSTRPSRP